MTQLSLKRGFANEKDLYDRITGGTSFTAQQLTLRVRNSSSIGQSAPQEISELGTGTENFQTSVIKGATSTHTVVGMRPTYVDLHLGLKGTTKEYYKLALEEVLLKVLRLKISLTEHIVILCGEDISVAKVYHAAVDLGYNPTSFPPAPSENEVQQLCTWVKGK